jgi:hypothetical protein
MILRAKEFLFEPVATEAEGLWLEIGLEDIFEPRWREVKGLFDVSISEDERSFSS